MDDITSGVTARNQAIVRQVLDGIRETNEEITNENVEKALDFLSRYDDREQVRDAYKKRWATKLKKAEDGDGYDSYVDDWDSKQVDKSEVINTGIGRRIADTVADSFTNPTGYFEWVADGADGKKEPVEDITAQIEDYRLKGGFHTEIANADTCSVAVNVGPMLTDWNGSPETGGFKYRSFTPSSLRAQYGERVIDNGVDRGVDYTDIGDALMVSVQLADGTATNTTASDKQQYLAMYGQSDQYPNGRHVHYEARKWDEVPEVGVKGCIDWEYGGGIANPLTIAGRLSGEAVPEYPIILLKGGLDITTDRLLPVSTSFYESVLELDVEFSRIAHCAMLAARGTNWIKDEMNQGLPATLEGDVPLRNGQELGNVGQPASNSQQVFEIAKGLSVLVAEGMSVPGYQVISGQSMPEAGIALMIKTQPLIDYRNKRAQLNKVEIEKQWQIERGLYHVYTGKPLAGPEVIQNWIAGRHIMPEDETAKLTRITMALDKGLMDPIGAIMDLYNLPHARAARAKLEEIAENKADFPDFATPAQPVRQGLQPRGKRVTTV